MLAQPNKVIFTSPASVAGNVEYDNQLIDFFYGGRNVYTVDGINPPLFTAGFFDMNYTYAVETDTVGTFLIDSTYTDSTYHDAFIIEFEHGDPFPKFTDNITAINYFITFVGASYLTADEDSSLMIGFWVKTDELNGNGLIFRDITGGNHIVSGSNIKTKGFTSTLWQVSQVIGDYSHLKFKLYNYIYASYPIFRLSIYPSSANDVTQLTILNPTLIYSRSINPFKRYTSQSEKDTSIFRGKRILYVGDSEYNQGYFHKTLAEYTGAIVIDEHYGGYAMQYRSPGDSWFYQDTIKNKVFAIPSVDVYFLPISSNDTPGGNLRTSAIDSVYYFYPAYGDDPDTVTAKLARFTSLSEDDKTSIFGFQQTYSAYIEQLENLNPTAEIILGSIPIGAGSGTMTGEVDENGYGIWAEGYSPAERVINMLPSQVEKTAQIEEIVALYSLGYIDLMNNVSLLLDYSNFNQYCLDGVHWGLQEGAIQKEIATLLKDYLK